MNFRANLGARKPSPFSMNPYDSFDLNVGSQPKLLDGWEIYVPIGESNSTFKRGQMMDRLES